MITYDNGEQFKVLLHTSGSVLPSCVPVSLVIGFMGTCLSILRHLGYDWYDENLISDPFAMQVVSVVIGFLLAMRANMALGRWMDGISEIQVMLSKWGDAFIALNAFFSGKEEKSTVETMEDILLFRVRIAHWFSLMSCLAFATLRSGKQDSLDEVPIRELFDQTANAKYSKSFTRTKFFKSFRGSMLMNFSDRATATSMTTEDLNVIHNPELIDDLDLYVLSAPTVEEIRILEMASDKVNTVCLWIVQGITREIRAGTLDTPPPIVTRVFQELSTGMLGFNQAHKVAMVPFPFPFAQMVGVVLLIFFVSLPFYLDRFTKSVVITPLISFFLPMCYYGLNRIAIELEEPFGTDCNDVDIEVRHEDFLWMLVDVLRMPIRPPVDVESKLECKILRRLVRNCTTFAKSLEKDGVAYILTSCTSI